MGILDAPPLGPGAFNAFNLKQARYRNLHSMALADRNASVSKATSAYGDNSSFTESWANFNNWVLPGTPGLQISNGAVYSNNGATGAGANHSFVVGVAQNMRAVFNLNVPSIPSGGVLVIGVSSDTAGSVPTAGAAKARGLYLSSAGVTQWDQGSGQQVLSSTISAGTYMCVIEADSVYLSVVMTRTDGSKEYRARWGRSGFNINNLFIFNSDSRQLGGMSIGPVGAKMAHATVSPRAGIEGVGGTVFWTGDSALTHSFRVVLPPNYESRSPSPLAIMFHGAGTLGEVVFADDPNSTYIPNALTAAGFIVASAQYMPYQNSWGSQNAVDTYTALYKYVRDNFNIGSVAIHCHSMGGTESLNCLARNIIPGVVSWSGTSVTANLGFNYTSALFKTDITNAYGIASDGSNYAAMTAGFDPILRSGDAFRELPMMIVYATDDTVVDYTQNAQKLIANVTPYCPDLRVSTTTGGHSFNWQPWASQFAAFHAQYAA